MEFKFIKDEKEFVEVHASERNELVNEIENLVNESFIDGMNINGYLENDVVPLKLKDIVSIYVEEDKTYASLMDKGYQIKMRLYQIEEHLNNDFIRINKSRIINRNYISKFDVSWSGTLQVFLKNGESDYVSRRQMKNVKERMNLK